jgi:hypothetical protein
VHGIIFVTRVSPGGIPALSPLEKSAVHREQFMIQLAKDRMTIGRFRALNDIGLEPDPQQLVTRRAHCIIEREIDTWWVIDNGSVNRIFVLRDNQMEVVNGRTAIEEGDTIRILGMITENGAPAYWNMVFHDPLKTNRFTQDSDAICLEYDWLEAKLFQVKGSRRNEIRNLRPQEHKIIRYMDQRNRANGYVAVMCTYEELMTAIWGEEPGHAESDVNHLIWELRQKAEPDPHRVR